MSEVKLLREDSRVLTVTQVNEHIKDMLESSPVLKNIYVKGEISNFTNHKTGHFYFTLKDGSGVLRAVMFRSSAEKLCFLPENGMKVIARGRISLFVRDGQYQIYCESLEADGVGSLYTAFEQLKKKLASEGLFDQKLKRPLPKIPLSVGIITSPTGAAVRDIINVAARRFPMAKLVVFPALVQGDGAAAQLISGIKYFGSGHHVDVIIIGRGGGSIEELWAFNDEGLARAVSACPVPVISAVGHETDFTICDFVADLRAPTPSAAAELALPDTSELKQRIQNVQRHMEVLLKAALERRRTVAASYAGSAALQSPMSMLEDRRMNLFYIEKHICSGLQLIIESKRSALGKAAAGLDALNPVAVLARGYSAVYNSAGGIVKSVDDVDTGETLTVKVSDGALSALVVEKHRNKEKARKD